MQIQEYYVGSKKLYSGRFWYYKNGKKKSKYKRGFTKKKDSENWCTDEKRRLEGLCIGSDKTKVREYLEQWIRTKKNKLSPSTLSGYKVNINHINEHIGETKLSELKLIDIQTMLDELSETGLKYRTVKYAYRTLHAAMEYAIKTEMLTRNVCRGAEIKEDEKKFEVRVYSAEDLNKLLLLLREQEHLLYPCVLLASMRGLRCGECLGLRWADVEFEKGIACIKNNYIKVRGIGYHRKVKTKDSEREINMEGFVATELKEYKNRNNKDGYIQTYVCEIDGKLPDPSHVSRKLNTFQKANNLPLCRFHDLRHTFAVLQLENGTDLDTLKRLLGHSKIGITSDTYLHQNSTLIRKASLSLDNIIALNCDKIVTKTENK